MDFERMQETNRIAIKFGTNGKIVIRKENMIIMIYIWLIFLQTLRLKVLV